MVSMHIDSDGGEEIEGGGTR